MFEFNATNRIAEAFEKRDIRFQVVNRSGEEELLTGFSIRCGPNILVRFISRSQNNDVAMRIFGLIASTPREKRGRLLEACNLLNHRFRYVKFCLDIDGDLNVGYDFPTHSPDDGLGEMAFEVFVRVMRILDAEYELFMKALYTEEELALPGPSASEELMQKLQELRQVMEKRMEEAEAAAEEGKEAAAEAEEECAGWGGGEEDAGEDCAC